MQRIMEKEEKIATRVMIKKRYVKIQSDSVCTKTSDSWALVPFFHFPSTMHYALCTMQYILSTDKCTFT
jgi:hypothetical protein